MIIKMSESHRTQQLKKKLGKVNTTKTFFTIVGVYAEGHMPNSGAVRTA